LLQALYQLLVRLERLPPAGNSTVTIGGDFNNGDTYAVSVNGKSLSITASSSDQYDNSSAGIAAQMKAAFDTAIAAAEAASLVGATQTADQLRLHGVDVADNGSGRLTFTTNVKSSDFIY
jgi:hypothetical protein